MAATSDIWKDRSHKNNLQSYCKYYIAKRLSDVEAVVYGKGAEKLCLRPADKGIYPFAGRQKGKRSILTMLQKGLKAAGDEQLKGFLINDNTKPSDVRIADYKMYRDISKRGYNSGQI